MTTKTRENKSLVQSEEGSQMRSDGVSIAFDVLREELDTFVAGVKRQGAECINLGDYDGAGRMIHRGKELEEFRSRVDGLSTEWLNWLYGNPDAGGSPQDRVGGPETQPPGIPEHKGPWTGLRVTFPDGTVVQEHLARDTFVRALQILGFRRVAELDEILAGRPVVSLKAGGDYIQEHVDDYYISYHCSTEEKKRKLSVIARKIGVPLKVDIL